MLKGILIGGGNNVGEHGAVPYALCAACVAMAVDMLEDMLGGGGAVGGGGGGLPFTKGLVDGLSTARSIEGGRGGAESGLGVIRV